MPKNQKNNSAAPVNVETTNDETEASVPTVAEQLAAIETAHGLFLAAMGQEAADSMRATSLAKLREPIVASFTEAIQAALTGAMESDEIAPTLGALIGSTFDAEVIFGADGTPTINVAERVAKKKGKGKGKGSNGSESTGNVLIVGKEAFFKYSDLCRVKGVAVDGASAKVKYEKASAKDAATYPAPTFVDYDTFFANPETFAPDGFYKYNKEAGDSILTTPVKGA